MITRSTKRSTAVSRLKGLVRDTAEQIAEIDLAQATEREATATNEQLRRSEERYQAVFEQAPDSILLVDAESGRIPEFNDLAHENLGYSCDAFARLSIADFEVVESPEGGPPMWSGSSALAATVSRPATARSPARSATCW